MAERSFAQLSRVLVPDEMQSAFAFLFLRFRAPSRPSSVSRDCFESRLLSSIKHRQSHSINGGVRDFTTAAGRARAPAVPAGHFIAANAAGGRKLSDALKSRIARCLSELRDRITDCRLTRLAARKRARTFGISRRSFRVYPRKRFPVAGARPLFLARSPGSKTRVTARGSAPPLPPSPARLFFEFHEFLMQRYIRVTLFGRITISRKPSILCKAPPRGDIS